MKIWIARIVFFSLFVFMSVVVIATSLQSNLFKEWDTLAQIPWLTATVKDFYVNAGVLCFWLYYREKKFCSFLVWTILFLALGSIATMFYFFLQTFNLKKEDSLVQLLLPKREMK
ncbi:MAG: DUF1475 family protein [Bacteriovoracaceae bacterium]|nr:DUF1475 family protein [Bacteriovoracaceae bacterium]